MTTKLRFNQYQALRTSCGFMYMFKTKICTFLILNWKGFLSYFFVEVFLFFKCWLEVKSSKVSIITCDNPCNKYECTQNTIVFLCKMISLRILPLNFNPIFLNMWWFDSLCSPSQNVKLVKLTSHELSMNSWPKCLNNYKHVVMLVLHHTISNFPSK